MQFVIFPMIFNIKIFLSLKRKEYFFKMYLVMIYAIANHYNSHRMDHIRYAKCGLAHAVRTPHAIRRGCNTTYIIVTLYSVKLRNSPTCAFFSVLSFAT